MRYYPILLNLENKPCLVVGAGDVGKRKLRSLLDAGAAPVTVLDTAPPDVELESILEMDGSIFKCRGFKEEDLDGQFLVIACTSNEVVNKLIRDLCTQRNILCNIVDQPESGSFIVPSTVTRGDLTLTISTNGKSPAMTKRIRKELQEYFGDEYSQLLTIMGRVRPKLLGLGMETRDNTKIFRKLVESHLLASLKEHDLDSAREILKESLPQPLHANISELLDGLV